MGGTGVSILIAILIALSAGAPGSKVVGAAPASAPSPGPVKQAPAPITQAPAPVKQAPAAGKPAAAGKSAAKVPTLDEIFAAMRRREESIKSFELIWRVYTILGAEAADNAAANVLGKEGRGTGAGKPLIANWVPGRVVVSGNKFRWDTTSFAFQRNSAGSTNSSIEAFNGTLDQKYLPKGGSRLSATGILNRMPSPYGKSHVTVAIPYAILQPFAQEQIPFDAKCASVDPRVASVNGCNCVVLRCRRRVFNDDEEWRCYLDPQRRFVPIRFEQDLRGHLAFETDVKEFWNDPVCGPVPKEWATVLHRANGDVVGQFLVSVSEYHLNRHVPDNEFNLTFPEGTAVLDGRAKGKHFVVDATGRIVPATPHLMSVPVDPDKPARWLRTILLWNTIVIVSLVIVIIFRRRRRTTP